MRHVAAAGLVLLAATEPRPPAHAQALPTPRPTTFGSERPVNVQDVYLQPLSAPLDEISGGLRTRQTVRTRGTLGLLEVGNPGYFLLREGTARVVVIPLPEVAQALHRLLDRRVEVAGYVRQLERGQGTCRFRGNMAAPQSLCEDPELPPKPDLDRPGRAGWPGMSITVWAGSDITPFEKPGGQPDRLGDVLDSAGRGMITAVGRFCGRSLCGGLLDAAPSGDAWVLADGHTAIWVVGRKAKGNGFSLDPAYKADTKHWLEVKGRLVTCGAARCLRASSVTLMARPEGEEPADEP